MLSGRFPALVLQWKIARCCKRCCCRRVTNSLLRTAVVTQRASNSACWRFGYFACFAITSSRNARIRIVYVIRFRVRDRTRSLVPLPNRFSISLCFRARGALVLQPLQSSPLRSPIASHHLASHRIVSMKSSPRTGSDGEEEHSSAAATLDQYGNATAAF